MSKDCTGLIVDVNTWEPVCLPIPKIPHYKDLENSQVENFDWDSATVYDYIDGLSVNMYYYNEEWHIASQCKIIYLNKKFTFVFRGAQ